MKSFFNRAVTINYRVVEVTNLAAKHGIKLVNGKFAAGCPGVMNPFETVDIEASWGYGAANADKTDRFNQFEKALNAAAAVVNRATHTDLSTAESSFHFCKNLFTSMNVYGRAMFMHIVEQSPVIDIHIRKSILTDVTEYASEGLNFNGTCNKNNVGAIFNSHITPKIDEFIASLGIKQLEEPKDTFIEVSKMPANGIIIKEPENSLEVLKLKYESLEVIRYVKMDRLDKFSDLNNYNYYYISGDKDGEYECYAEDNDLELTQLYKNYTSMRAPGNIVTPNKLNILIQSSLETLKKEPNIEKMLLKDVPFYNLSNQIISETHKSNTVQTEFEITTAPKKSIKDDANEEVLEIIKELIEENIRTVESKDGKIQVMTNNSYNWIHDIVAENNLDSPDFDYITYLLIHGRLKLVADIADIIDQ